MGRLFHTRANKAGLNRSRPTIKINTQCIVFEGGGKYGLKRLKINCGEKERQNVEDKL